MPQAQDGSKNPFSSGYTGPSKPSLHVADNPSQRLNTQQSGPDHREAGEEDEAGNKIPHKGFFNRLVHGEHVALNAEQEWEGEHVKDRPIGEHK
ncbi:MAG: hypothetical protein M1821_009157 [Bathelium mastoideum]|nr:MAG: hypothetical protein M1821_009157 [Bathelium mastoideum]KAI9689523.1 MAG: hypothetical protein M1822_010174 [Bathelium mastoideum]